MGSIKVRLVRSTRSALQENIFACYISKERLRWSGRRAARDALKQFNEAMKSELIFLEVVQIERTEWFLVPMLQCSNVTNQRNPAVSGVPMR